VVPRIALKVVQQRVAFKKNQSAIALVVSPIQPLERQISLSAERVNFCDLVRTTVMILGDICSCLF